MFELIWQPLFETLQMLVFSTFFSIILGLPLGMILVVSDPKGLKANKVIYQLISSFVNLSRSIPFIILMILLFPLSRWLVGTTIGTAATIVPLSIGAMPFVGRIIESALKEVPKGLVEAARAMGASNLEIILKVLLPEALPGILRGLTLLMINLVGYSAMAGTIGGGGLGDLAIRYGYHRYQMDVLIVSVVVIILLVQFIQTVGNHLTYYILNH
jgi:D-methionine transport system permease protein